MVAIGIEVVPVVLGTDEINQGQYEEQRDRNVKGQHFCGSRKRSQEETQKEESESWRKAREGSILKAKGREILLSSHPNLVFSQAFPSQ